MQLTSSRASSLILWIHIIRKKPNHEQNKHSKENAYFLEYMTFTIKSFLPTFSIWDVFLKAFWHLFSDSCLLYINIYVCYYNL